MLFLLVDDGMVVVIFLLVNGNFGNIIEGFIVNYIRVVNVVYFIFNLIFGISIIF